MIPRDPDLLNAGDPSSQDEALFTPGDPDNYARFGGGALDSGRQRAAELALHDEIQRWLAGERPFAGLEGLARAASAVFPLRHDRRRLHDAVVPLPDAVLADIVEDELADATVRVERITGDAMSRPTVGVLAALAWSESGGERRVVDAWFDDERDRSLTHAMRCVDRAPPMLYADGRPLLPLAPQMTPPAGPPGVYVARAYRLGAEWAWSSRVELPAAPAIVPLQRRLDVEMWRLRTIERRSTWEDVLRRRGEVLYRASSEGAWRTMSGG